jgi:hypothetical protein
MSGEPSFVFDSMCGFGFDAIQSKNPNPKEHFGIIKSSF